MAVDMIRSVLGWCTIINMGILLVWFLFWVFAKEVIFSLHGKWFSVSREQFAAIHYLGMMLFKLGILLLNLVPYIALNLLH